MWDPTDQQTHLNCPTLTPLYERVITQNRIKSSNTQHEIILLWSFFFFFKAGVSKERRRNKLILFGEKMHALPFTDAFVLMVLWFILFHSVDCRKIQYRQKYNLYTWLNVEYSFERENRTQCNTFLHFKRNLTWPPFMRSLEQIRWKLQSVDGTGPQFVCVGRINSTEIVWSSWL